jgi:hypothetical protein
VSIVATDVWHPVRVRDTTNGRFLDFDSIDVIEDSTKTAGKSTRYHWFGGVITVERLAESDTAYKIWYIKEPAEMGALESPPINRIYDLWIVAYAAKVGLENVGEFQKAQVQETQAKNYVADLKLPTFEVKKDDKRTGVRVRYR